MDELRIMNYKIVTSDQKIGMNGEGECSSPVL